MGKKKTRPNWIFARIVKKRSEANGRQKVLRRVIFGIEQGGRQKFMLRWRFQEMVRQWKRDGNDGKEKEGDGKAMERLCFAGRCCVFFVVDCWS